jgi:hypothetical protein
MVARKLGKCKLDLAGVQEVRWEKGGTDWAEEYTFFYGEGKEDNQLGTGFFIHSFLWRYSPNWALASSFFF